jgi:hypothetical protein
MGRMVGAFFFVCSEHGTNPLHGARKSLLSLKLKVSFCSLDEIFQSHGCPFPTPKLGKNDDIL